MFNNIKPITTIYIYHSSVKLQTFIDRNNRLRSMEIQVLVVDRLKNVAGLNQIWDSKFSNPSFFISISTAVKQYFAN